MIYYDKQQLIEWKIKPTDSVLDVGFWGQGVGISSRYWPHRFILAVSKNVYGVDLDFDAASIKEFAAPANYQKANAECFKFEHEFDVIFAGDIIEHLSNPGLFLGSCRSNLKKDGILIVTTPNVFNLFNLAEKISKREPTVNSDHICYFNSKTLKKIFEKNGFEVKEISYLYTVHAQFRESFKKKFLNIIYFLLSKFSDKFIETLVVVAKKI